MRKKHLTFFRFGLIIIGLPVLTYLMSFSAIAETRLTTIPESLNVTGTRGIDEVRTLVLSRSVTTQNWKITSVDLSRKDGLAVFPSSLIQPIPSNGTEILGNDLVSIPVLFKLSNTNTSGQFSGSLLVRYDGGDTVVPVTLTIKDQFYFPLLLLLLGVIAGTSLSTYQAEGLDRDEVILQIEKLQVQMQADEEFKNSFSQDNNPFLNKINGILIKTETALETKKWEEARIHADNAKSIWNKWRTDKSEWLRLLKYKEDELNSRLDQDLSSNIPYGKSVKNNIENAISQMPECDSLQQFRDKLQDIQHQITRYLQGQQQLDRFNQLKNQSTNISELPQLKEDFWREKLISFQQRLEYLVPNDVSSFSSWQQDVTAALTQMREDLEKSAVLQEAELQVHNATRDAEIISNMKNPVLDLPFISLRNKEEGSEQAKRRIEIYRQLIKWLAIISLSGVGFNQLYVSNSTFGANWFGDYFTLLAWGFGAEVSRESVTKVLQRVQLPRK